MYLVSSRLRRPCVTSDLNAASLTFAPSVLTGGGGGGGGGTGTKRPNVRYIIESVESITTRDSP